MRTFSVAVLCLGALATVQHAPAARVVAHIQYRAVSEDETTNTGGVALDLRPGESGAAVVWEQDCELGGEIGPTVPDGAEQFWTFRVSRAKDQPGVQVRYRHVQGARRVPPPEEAVTLPADGSHPLTLSALSASTLCRYDRIALTVSAMAVR